MARQFVLKRNPPSEPSRTLIDYTGALNPQQHAAATASGGPFLVVAGAGTGKTRTLVYRLAYLVEMGVRPQHIALLTFTNRAAREMLARAEKLLDGRCRNVRGGTFHAFCLRTLRQYCETIGFKPNFTVLDASDSADVIGVLRARLQSREKRFPKQKAIQAMFSAATNQQQSLREIVEVQYPQFEEQVEELLSLWQEYAEYKRQHYLMDFDDLLTWTLRLFENHTATGRQIAAQCLHVLVDEYQDTNRLQAKLVRHFAAVHGNVMAVGDDAQSIYRFRGADYTNLSQFSDWFPGAKVLKLERNYRSTRPILQLANHVLKQSHTRFDKTLYTEDKPEGEMPALVLLRDKKDESHFVAQQVLELREQGIPLDRIAVFFRNSTSSWELESELNLRNIPFVKHGGLKLSEAAHIRDILAFVRVLENPQDAASWHRLLLLIPGLGSQTARRLIESLPFGHPFVFDASVRPRVHGALERLSTILSEASAPGKMLVQQVEAVAEYYRPLCKLRYADDFDRRWQDVEQFVSLASTYSDRRVFLSSVALDPLDRTLREAGETSPDEEPLVLSTIHSAKGLEFHSVFLIRALDGVLPIAHAFGDTEALDEELRLLYVAITRAEEDLIISYPLEEGHRFGGSNLSLPSRFLNDIPDTLLEPYVLGFDDQERVSEHILSDGTTPSDDAR